MSGKGIITLALIIVALVQQIWAGWFMAILMSALVWIMLFGEEILVDQFGKVHAASSGCPYCAWGKPHAKGADCAS